MERSGNEWTRAITVEQAFRAVRKLVFIYWETGGKTEDEIAAFGSSLSGDPALESDWLRAVDKVLV